MSTSFKTYPQTINYLYEQLPMYQRTGSFGNRKIDLRTITALCKILKNPHREFKSIHVAGTNGKGSTSHFITSILQEAGYKTGLYTSPHYYDFRERIRINGKPISKKAVINFMNKWNHQFTNTKPSFFELTVAMAFEIFKQEKVDYAVIETGLGGRLDSTNIITPILSVITNISKDHQNVLGNTLSKIAYEKAGIIKSRIPVLISQKQKRVADVFKNKAKQQNAPIHFAEDFSVRVSLSPKLKLKIGKDHQVIDENFHPAAKYQLKNIKGAIAAAILLDKKRGIRISPNHMTSGIRNAVKNTGLAGRYQIIQESPVKIICDGAHNIDGVRNLKRQIKTEQYKKLRVVLGFVKGKKLNSILDHFPTNATYYFTQPLIARKFEASELKRIAKSKNLKGEVYNSVIIAYEKAIIDSKPGDLILITGSIFVVSEIPK